MSKLKSKKTWLIVLLIIAAAVITGFLLKKEDPAGEKEIQYEEAKVQRGDIIVGQDSDGEIEFSKVNLRFGIQGTIAEILVKEGDTIEKGTVIGRLDDKDYQDQYQLALAKLKDAQEQEQISILSDELKLENLKAELETLESTSQEMDQIPEAYSSQEITEKKRELARKELEYQNALKEYEISLNNFENKDSELDQNELAVKMAREDLEDTILYAPVSGTILDLSKKAGESVNDEEDFVVVHENNEIKATTMVIEYDISTIKIGQQVNISVEAIPDKTYRGIVSNIDAIPTTDSSGLVSYTVEVDIQNADLEIRDGMTCTLTFLLKEVRDVLIVPYKAVKIVNKKQFVTILDQNGQQKDQEIKTGFTDGTSVEVLEGLEVNNTVVYAKSR
ncbi:MAG: efflux RND transporter periplasmic adaptor subunit [Peptococcaceae bacterium]